MNMDNHPENHSHDEEPKTLSLLSGVAAAGPPTDAELLEARGGRGVAMGRGAAIIVGLALLAAGILYGMRQMQGDLTVAGGKEAESRIENFVAKVAHRDKLSEDHPYREENIEALFQNADAVVAMFDSDVTERQVPLEFVKKNPFQLTTTRPKTDAAAPIDTSDYARAQRLRELKTELARYRLDSVMTGPRNVAVINGEFAQERQRLGSFTIVKIEPLAVTLAAEGDTFQLTIDHDPNRRGR